MSQKWKNQNKQKPQSKGNWYLSAGEHCVQTSKSLTAQREQVTAGKNYLLGLSTYYANKKEEC